MRMAASRSTATGRECSLSWPRRAPSSTISAILLQLSSSGSLFPPSIILVAFLPIHSWSCRLLTSSAVGYRLVLACNTTWQTGTLVFTL
uniref:Uncharacterized protein n=1 Tax=Rhizophora mucronata TaxID=61149 RepID=A0A2P2J9B0_RHIMU